MRRRSGQMRARGGPRVRVRRACAAEAAASGSTGVAAANPGAQLLLVIVACLWLPGAGEGAADALAQGECRPPDRIAVRAVLVPAPAVRAAMQRFAVALPQTRARGRGHGLLRGKLTRACAASAVRGRAGLSVGAARASRGRRGGAPHDGARGHGCDGEAARTQRKTSPLAPVATQCLPVASRCRVRCCRAAQGGANAAISSSLAFLAYPRPRAPSQRGRVNTRLALPPVSRRGLSTTCISRGLLPPIACCSRWGVSVSLKCARRGSGNYALFANPCFLPVVQRAACRARARARARACVHPQRADTAHRSG